jgi:response regulator RpfG family c-di-GMP phosphodiesterase
LSVSSASLIEGAGSGKSVRQLLDEARAVEGDDLTRSRSLIQQARVLARSNADQQGEAEALYRLAAVTYHLGQMDEAFALALEARDSARRCGVPIVESSALHLVSIVYQSAGNFSQALENALQALEVYRSTNDVGLEGNLLNAIASIHHSLRDTDRALVTYEAALEANRQGERPAFDAITLANMAKVRAERHENFLAVSLGEAALEIARVHLPTQVVEILADLADSYTALSMIPKAKECIQSALNALADLGELGPEVARRLGFAVAISRSRVLVADGETSAAISLLIEVVDEADERLYAEVALIAHQLLADVLKSLERFEEALAHRETWSRIHDEIFNRDTDLRIKTLQISHDTLAARDQAELLRVRTTELEELVRSRTQDLEEQHYEAFERLARISEYRDVDTGEHSSRVGELAADLARQLGEDPAWANALRLAGRLHDVGKVAVPDSVLLKPGALTAEEFEIMKTHTTVGATVFAGSNSALIKLAAEVANSHHEHWDGSGYPRGLAGDDIPLSGRIIAVADVYDALVHAHLYKPAWASADAVRHIVSEKGAHFEPRIVDALVSVIHRIAADHASAGPRDN